MEIIPLPFYIDVRSRLISFHRLILAGNLSMFDFIISFFRFIFSKSGRRSCMNGGAMPIIFLEQVEIDFIELISKSNLLNIYLTTMLVYQAQSCTF